jgi:uncharacterized membrane protein
MILTVLHIAAGLLFAVFLPGYLLSLVLFKNISSLERLCLSVGLSFSLMIFLGFLLTLLLKLAGEKMISPGGIWLSLVIICLICLDILLVRGELKIKNLRGIIGRWRD